MRRINVIPGTVRWINAPPAGALKVGCRPKQREVAMPNPCQVVVPGSPAFGQGRREADRGAAATDPGLGLYMPARPIGIVILAGAGPRRGDPLRLREASGYLQRRGIATLVMPADPEGYQPDGGDELAQIQRLVDRTRQWIDWVNAHAELKALPLGLSGAGRSGAAMLLSAAAPASRVAAIVVRSAQLDPILPQVSHMSVPVLLIAPGQDADMLALTQRAYHRLSADTKRIEAIPRATRFFEEAGAFEQASMTTAQWFVTHFVPGS